MESVETVVSRGAMFRKFSIDDSELNSWKRNGRRQCGNYCSCSRSNNHYTLQPFPELLSFGVDHSTVLRQSVFRPVPKYARHSSSPGEKKHPFRRSASGSQLMKNGSVYAGARFSEAPSPKLLPLPPRHWLDGISAQRPALCGEMTRQLKSVLQVK